MAEFTLKMADLSTNSDQVRIVQWLVELGCEVECGQYLYEAETDKATIEVESPVSGKLVSILVQEGECATVGQDVAIFENDKPTAQDGKHPLRPDRTSTVATDNKPQSELNLSAPSVNRPRQSFFARNKANADVDGDKRSVMELTGVQRIVADRMRESKQTVPHFYLADSANVESLIRIRQDAAAENPPKKIVWDAFFVQATARALKKFERMTYRFANNQLVKSPNDAIGVAVDINDNLYVISLKSPLTKSIFQISDEIQLRVNQIRQGDPSAKKLEPSCITISNLGGTGIESFIAIVNPPESSILAIGTIVALPVVDHGNVVVRQQAKLSLSVDHRVVSGKYAACFLHAIVEEIRIIEKN